LVENEISVIGARYFAQILENNSTIESLDLQGFYPFFIFIYFFFLHFLNLFFLSFQTENKIGDAGAVELANALSANTSLQELYLNGFFLFFFFL